MSEGERETERGSLDPELVQSIGPIDFDHSPRQCEIISYLLYLCGQLMYCSSGEPYHELHPFEAMERMVKQLRRDMSE